MVDVSAILTSQVTWIWRLRFARPNKLASAPPGFDPSTAVYFDDTDVDMDVDPEEVPEVAVTVTEDAYPEDEQL